MDKNVLMVLQTKEARLATYKKAIECIDGMNYKNYDLTAPFLCLLLPCILWRLSNFITKAPNGEGWQLIYVVDMFPELQELLDEGSDSITTQMRLEYLNKWVKELS